MGTISQHQKKFIGFSKQPLFENSKYKDMNRSSYNFELQSQWNMYSKNGMNIIELLWNLTKIIIYHG